MKFRQENIIQIIWGGLLLLMGIALLFRIPHIIPKIQEVDAFSSEINFKRICLYLVCCLLIGGGVKKIKAQYKILACSRETHPAEK